MKDAEREMRIKLAEANARAVEGENTSKAEIAASQAALQVKQAESYELGETRHRVAEAAVLEAQHRAMAKAALAEAEEIEAERRAELEAPAKAEKARIVVEAEAEAEKRRLEAEGEAKAIFARLEAEARGQYEILAKKGEGLREIIERLRRGRSRPSKLLMLEHFDNLVDASAKAISNIKFDKVVVWEGNGHERHELHGQLAAEHGPHAAADDAGHEGHRRGGDPRRAGKLRGQGAEACGGRHGGAYSAGRQRPPGLIHRADRTRAGRARLDPPASFLAGVCNPLRVRRAAQSVGIVSRWSPWK